MVDDVFIDIPASIIDDQLIDKEKGTYISEDLRGGIILIDIPLGGEDVPPLLVQPLLEPKDEIHIFTHCILLYGDFSNNKTNIYELRIV